jgi:Holliday junction resolvase
VSRGHDRERAVKRLLESQDWWIARAAGSLGDADLVALKDGKRPLLIEVKSTAGGPYERFGPKDRADLRFAARLAGASAVLYWWPPRGKVADHLAGVVARIEARVSITPECGPQVGPQVVLFCGGRNCTIESHGAMVEADLRTLHKDSIVVHGGAPGADDLVQHYAYWLE